MTKSLFLLYSIKIWKLSKTPYYQMTFNFFYLGRGGVTLPDHFRDIDEKHHITEWLQAFQPILHLFTWNKLYTKHQITKTPDMKIEQDKEKREARSDQNTQNTLVTRPFMAFF